MSAPASLAAALPYWTTLQVPVPASAEQPDGSFACLVMKDGSVAIGIATAAVDALAQDAKGLDAHAAVWRQALASLPDGAYLQTTYSAGFAFDDVIGRFAKAGAADSHPLLRHGRNNIAAGCRAERALQRVEITHWLGQRRVLAGLHKKPKWGQLAHNTAQVRAACQSFWQQLQPLLSALRSGHLAPQVLDEAALKVKAAQSIGHVMAPVPALPPTPLCSPNDIVDQAHGAALLPGQANLDVQLAEGCLRVAADHLQWQHSGTVLQAASVSRLGEATHANVLVPLCSEDGPTTPFVLSVCHEKTQQTLQKERLEQRRKWLFALIGSHFLNHDAKRAYEQAEQLLAEIARDGAQIFRSSISCVTSGKSAQEAAHQSRRAADALRVHHVHLGVQHQRQLAAWQASLPGYGYSAPRSLLLLDGNCSHLVPNFRSAAGDPDADLLFHNRQRALIGLSIRVGRRHDASAIIIGKTGSGKTFLFSYLAKYGCLDLGGHVVLADNKGPKNSSYRPLCELLGGQYVHLEADESVNFNFFPPREAVLQNGEVEPASVHIVESILATMVEDSRAAEHEDYVRSVLSDAVRGVYEQAKNHRRPLVLSDAVAALRALAPRNDNLAAVARRVAERLEFWCDDPVRRRLFNRPAKLDATNRFCVFDFFGLDRDPNLGAVLISAFSGRIEQKMRELPVSVPKVFAFDEAWAMFDASPRAAALMNRLYRTARSYGAACYILTQDSRDIMQSAAASGILANLALVFLLRHQDGHKVAADLFGLNERQAELFASLRMEPGQYAEALLLDGNAQAAHLLRYRPQPFDLWCDTSRPADVALRRAAAAAPAADEQQGLLATIKALAELAPRGAPANEQTRTQLLAALAQRNSASPAPPPAKVAMPCAS